jgi:predicted transcriptional regulator
VQGGCDVGFQAWAVFGGLAYDPWYQSRYHKRMAMTLRLADDETEALRRRAELEHRSMQEVARQAIREYVENHSRAELLDQVLDDELPRYAEALERLGQ